MKKFWFIMKIIFLIIATLAMLAYGTLVLDVCCAVWLGWKTIVSIFCALFYFIMAFKGCRLVVEEIAKEMTK